MLQKWPVRQRRICSKLPHRTQSPGSGSGCLLSVAKGCGRIRPLRQQQAVVSTSWPSGPGRNRSHRLRRRGNEMTDILMNSRNWKTPRRTPHEEDRPHCQHLRHARGGTSVYQHHHREYFRDMGYSVALMADSTSVGRALGDVPSGKMPGEEGYGLFGFPPGRVLRRAGRWSAWAVMA